MSTQETPRELRDALALLLKRYQYLLSLGGLTREQETIKRHSAAGLAMAVALSDRLLNDLSTHQIVVLGPTQVGKSTISNVLFGDVVAQVSPLAGYTAHAQGFSTHALSADEQNKLSAFFSDYQRVDQSELSQENSETYCLVESRSEHFEGPAIIWDSPDFDSVSAVNYWHSVVRLRALADVVLLVLSKDKYADQSVWDLLSLTQLLKTPTVVVLNKLDEESEPLITQSFLDRWKMQMGDQPDAILTRHYFSSDTAPDNKWNEQLRDSIQKALMKTGDSHSAVERFIQTYWSEWVSPVEREIEQQQLWLKIVDEQTAEFLQSYKKQYQTQPENYESLQLAIVKLLDLLEVPVFGTVMSSARHVVTWPVKKLFGWGEQTQNEQQANAAASERALLQQLGRLAREACLMRAMEERDKKSNDNAWWQSKFNQMKASQEAEYQQLDLAITCHIDEFSIEIDQAAHRLFDKLQTQPLLLNSLRAARVTTDAAAVVLAVKSGGLGAADLVLAPAMLTLTSLLTESTLGGYMKIIAKELQEKQSQSVNRHIVVNTLRPSWAEDLSLTMSTEGDVPIFGLSQTWLTQTQRLLKEGVK